MNKKDTSNMMKIMGATLAVCSAAAIMGGMKSNSFSAKKTMKKAGLLLMSLALSTALWAESPEKKGLGSPDKPGGLSIQLCKSEKKEFYIRYSS